MLAIAIAACGAPQSPRHEAPVHDDGVEANANHVPALAQISAVLDRTALGEGELDAGPSDTELDATLPSEPTDAGPDWRPRCIEALGAARVTLARHDPTFASAQAWSEDAPRGVRFEMSVADPEHARFFAGAPALYSVHVYEHAGEPGEIGASVGGGDDDAQTSLGLSRCTASRCLEIEAEVVRGGPAARFVRDFAYALDVCLGRRS